MENIKMTNEQAAEIATRLTIALLENKLLANLPVYYPNKPSKTTNSIAQVVLAIQENLLNGRQPDMAKPSNPVQGK